MHPLRSLASMSLTVFVFGLCAPSASAEPPTETCKYQDARGNCVSTPPFSRRKRQPQKIAIDSEPPGADVWLDGKNLGQTPLFVKQRLRPGSHTLVVRKQLFSEYAETIAVRRYGKQVFTATLQPWPRLTVKRPVDEAEKSNPARLRIDGQLISGPWKDMQLPPGKYFVQVERPGFRDWFVIVELTPQINELLTPSLEKQTGSLIIETNLNRLPVFLVPTRACESIGGGYDEPFSGDKPDDAVVPLGELGPWQLKVTDLAPGRHCVEFRIAGLGVQRRLLTVGERQASFYRFTFQRPPVSDRFRQLLRFWGRWREQRAWATCREEPDDVVEDPTRAETCLRLAMVYHRDRLDLERASTAYRSACHAGAPEACEAYGWLVSTGTGRPPLKPDVVREVYDQACTAGSALACYLRHEPSDLRSPGIPPRTTS